MTMLKCSKNILNTWFIACVCFFLSYESALAQENVTSVTDATDATPSSPTPAITAPTESTKASVPTQSPKQKADEKKSPAVHLFLGYSSIFGYEYPVEDMVESNNPNLESKFRSLSSGFEVYLGIPVNPYIMTSIDYMLNIRQQEQAELGTDSLDNFFKSLLYQNSLLAGVRLLPIPYLYLEALFGFVVNVDVNSSYDTPNLISNQNWYIAENNIGGQIKLGGGLSFPVHSKINIVLEASWLTSYFTIPESSDYIPPVKDSSYRGNEGKTLIASEMLLAVGVEFLFPVEPKPVYFYY